MDAETCIHARQKGEASCAISLALLPSRAARITLGGRAVTLFAVFILLLDLDHLLNMRTIFVAICRLKVIVLATTAAVSLTLAVFTVGQIVKIRANPHEGE